ncbi:MAG: ATP-binding protein [Nanoarchaeota archaeon]
MQEIVIGRSKSDLKKYGKRGTILIGKQYIRMGQSVTLSGEIYLDISGAHVIFICGKRGGGKSYTMGSITEGMFLLEDDVKQNLAFILLDTMGIYWTMKYPNHAEEELLKQWNLEGRGIDLKIYTPFGWYKKFKERGLPTDAPFSLKPSELTSEDWCMTFGISPISPPGILIDEVLQNFNEEGRTDFSIDEFIEAVMKIEDADDATKAAVKNLLRGTRQWGLFDKQGTPLREIAKSGQISVLDVSCYAFMPNGWAVKALVVGIVAQKLFIERMKERKEEEFNSVDSAQHYFTSEDTTSKQKFPLVWLVIDEAHEFLPKDPKDANPATMPLVTIMREGRQPGISLILATQQPGKIHTDVMTQSDTVLSHRITARLDVEALGMLTQSYMKEGLTDAIDHLPREKGAAVLFDDANERLYPMRMRPRFTWHGGSSPLAVKVKKEFNL